jgi:hypothetical protein
MNKKNKNGCGGWTLASADEEWSKVQYIKGKDYWVSNS